MKLPDFLAGVQLIIGPVPAGLGEGRARGVLWQAASGRFLLEVPAVASYYAAGGEQITIHPCPGVGDKILQCYLGLAPLAALIFQRGWLAFHAAAAAPPLEGIRTEGAAQSIAGLQTMKRADSGAVLLAGDSGAGKSTLLAALLQRGWRLLADDLAAVGLDGEGRPVVWPIPAEIALWPDAVEKLGIVHEGASGVTGISGETGVIDETGFSDETGASDETGPDPRQFYDFTAQCAEAALPLQAIYWLSVQRGEEIQVEEVQGSERFAAIGPRLYNSHIADALLDRSVYFRLATAITQAVPLRRIRRPEGQWSVEALVEKLEADWR